MEVSSKGKITWKVPPNFKDETVDVIVSITDGDSAQTYESFTIYKAMK
jgi:predicted Zn-dependent protease with MMP-like domain